MPGASGLCVLVVGGVARVLSRSGDGFVVLCGGVLGNTARVVTGFHLPSLVWGVPEPALRALAAATWCAPEFAHLGKVCFARIRNPSFG